MQQLLVIIIMIALGIIAVLIYTLYKKIVSTESIESRGDTQLLLLLQQQLQEQSKAMTDLGSLVNQKMLDGYQTIQQTQHQLHTALREQFSENTRIIQHISGQSTKMIGDIAEKLTSLDKTNQQVIGFSEQLGQLEKILTSQKQRGNLGETGLRLVLENILPPTAFSLQYQFSDGETVDAAVFTKDGIIPIDAKFSLENYTRIINESDPTKKISYEKDFKNDLKKRIDETSKYIKPKEGTLDFAFMFIPAEGIYYDLLVNEVGAVSVNTRSLIDYAFKEKKVVIVSPTTFAAYLQTVLQGLRAFQIEESAKSIRQNVMMLQKHLHAYESFMKKLGTNLGTTVNQYNAAYKELGKIDKDVVRITDGERLIEPELLEKPTAQNEE